MELSKENYDFLFDVLTKLRPRYPESFDYFYGPDQIDEMIRGNYPLSMIAVPDTFYNIENDKITYFSSPRDTPATSIEEEIFIKLPNLIELGLDLEFAEIPGNIFSNLGKLEILRLGLDKCKKIPNSLFYNLDNLLKLSFNTDCEDIPSNILDPLINLSILHFGISIPSDPPLTIFSNLKNLSSLYLNLRIKNIQTELFKELENLRTLNIHSLVLKHVPINIFQYLINLEELVIYTNQNLILSIDHLSPLRKLKKMRLSKNIVLEEINSSKYEIFRSI